MDVEVLSSGDENAAAALVPVPTRAGVVVPGSSSDKAPAPVRTRTRPSLNQLGCGSGLLCISFQ